MPTLPVPIPATALGPISAATVTFRSRGLLHVTAIVKATFALAPEARMTPLVPDPIVADELPDPSGRGLRSAGDLAPYLGETDVLLTGHAAVLPTFSATELRVWLAVARDRIMHIDRWLELDATARVGRTRGHVHIDGAGPLSRDWPRRNQLLEGLDPRRLHAPHIEIPDGLDWTYFQAAPAEQRMELLRGDEWLVLGGIFAQRPKLRTQLPEARGVARLYRRGEPLPRAGVPIPLVADTLVIDVDRRCASILWRGHIQVEEAELASLQVVAGMALPGREIVWVDPFPAPIEDILAGTLMVPDEVARKLAEAPAMPFVRLDESTLEAEAALAGTIVISDEVARKIAGASATPFQKPAAAAPEVEDLLAGTLTFPAGLVQKLAAAPAMPFKSQWDSHLPRVESSLAVRPGGGGEAPTLQAPSLRTPEAEDPLLGTLTVPDDVARLLANVPVTPFDRGSVALFEPPRVEAGEAREDGVLASWREDIVIPIAMAEVAPPALMIASEEQASAEPEDLEAEFLAAMSAAGEPV